MLEAKDEKIAKATKVLNLLSSDPETVRLAELREKAIWDEVSRMNGARAEGIQQGKTDIARRMLAQGYSVEDIADITGLSLEEIRKLQN